MSITINASNQLTSPGNYISQAYEKSRSEGMKNRQEKVDPKAHAIKEPEPDLEHNLGKSSLSTEKTEDAVVVDISRKRLEDVESKPSTEEIEEDVSAQEVPQPEE